MCRRSRSASDSQCSVSVSSIGPGPEMNASRSRQSEQSSSSVAVVDAAVLARVLLVQAEALVALRELAQLGAEDHVARGCARSGSAARRRARPRWARLRSMLMIGVMPLPALTKRSFSGSGSGSVKSPSTPPRLTMLPGLPRFTRHGDTTPSSTCFTVMLMKPSGAIGVGGERVGAPVAAAAGVDPDAQVLAGLVAHPVVARADDHGGGVGRLAADLLDAPAQLARGPQRVDHLEVVVGQQRRGERRTARSTVCCNLGTLGLAPFSAIRGVVSPMRTYVNHSFPKSPTSPDPRAGPRGRHPHAVRRARDAGRADRADREGGRHRARARVPPLLLQGGAVRAHGDRLPGRARRRSWRRRSRAGARPPPGSSAAPRPTRGSACATPRSSTARCR